MRNLFICFLTVITVSAGIYGDTSPGTIEYRFQFSPDGQYLAAADNYGHVQVRDMVSKKFQYAFFRAGRIRTMAFSEDNHYLAAGFELGINANLCLWDLKTGNAVLYQTIMPKMSYVFFAEIQFLPSSQLLMVRLAHSGCCSISGQENESEIFPGNL